MKKPAYGRMTATTAAGLAIAMVMQTSMAGAQENPVLPEVGVEFADMTNGDVFADLEVDESTLAKVKATVDSWLGAAADAEDEFSQLADAVDSLITQFAPKVSAVNSDSKLTVVSWALSVDELASAYGDDTTTLELLNNKDTTHMVIVDLPAGVDTNSVIVKRNGEVVKAALTKDTQSFVVSAKSGDRLEVSANVAGKAVDELAALSLPVTDAEGKAVVPVLTNAHIAAVLSMIGAGVNANGAVVDSTGKPVDFSTVAVGLDAPGVEIAKDIANGDLAVNDGVSQANELASQAVAYLQRATPQQRQALAEELMPYQAIGDDVVIIEGEVTEDEATDGEAADTEDTPAPTGLSSTLLGGLFGNGDDAATDAEDVEPEYQVDPETGELLLDENGNPIPVDPDTGGTGLSSENTSLLSKVLLGLGAVAGGVALASLLGGGSSQSPAGGAVATDARGEAGSSSLSSNSGSSSSGGNAISNARDLNTFRTSVGKITDVAVLESVYEELTSGDSATILANADKIKIVNDRIVALGGKPITDNGGANNTATAPNTGIAALDDAAFGEAIAQLSNVEDLTKIRAGLTTKPDDIVRNAAKIQMVDARIAQLGGETAQLSEQELAQLRSQGGSGFATGSDSGIENGLMRADDRTVSLGEYPTGTGTGTGSGFGTGTTSASGTGNVNGGAGGMASNGGASTANGETMVSGNGGAPAVDYNAAAADELALTGVSESTNTRIAGAIAFAVLTALAGFAMLVTRRRNEG